MTDLHTRLRSALEDAKQRRMLTVRVDLDDLEGLLEAADIVHRPAVSFTATFPNFDLEQYLTERFTAMLAKARTEWDDLT